MTVIDLKNAPLGKQASYTANYQRDLLFIIPRKMKHAEIGIHGELPFKGADIWTNYELSWLNTNGKPMIAICEFIIPCESPNLVESKSIKLYMVSLNNTRFDSVEALQATITRDLSEAAGAPVSVKIIPLAQMPEKIATQFSGVSLDALDITCDTYTTQPAFLTTENALVTETLHSDLLRSNCLITNQPDWGSVQITYTGKKISASGLLKYIVSFRNHNEFHEQCVERIFMDIMKQCAPEKLFVYARYTRRGGLDINPYRANYAIQLENIRLCRQ